MQSPERKLQVTLEGFIEYCDMIAFSQPDLLLGEDEYKESDWNEADRLQLRQLHTMLDGWKIVISDVASADPAEQHW